MRPIHATDALTLAQMVRSGRLTAESVIEHTLSRIARLDGSLNCFTAVLADRAIQAARALDFRIRLGVDPGPLCGVPFGVKNLFDISGLVTLAGSKILRERQPATHDAAVISHMQDAGGILVGTLNMDEFAYGFTTENEHYGATRNPHDLARIAGGSSGGSAAAVAARLLPITFGSDTNGSVRVPASLCGVFGLKPTYGRLSRAGLFPFVDSLDHVGLFARTTRELALAYDVMQGGNAEERVVRGRPIERTVPALEQDADTLRVGILEGWFQQHAGGEVQAVMEKVAAALREPGRVELPRADVARAAAFCITAAESGSLHLDNLRSRPQDFDQSTRDRFLAGALLPPSVIVEAHRFRSWFRDEVRKVFHRYDLLIAPTTFCAAPRLGQANVRHGDEILSVRANLGLFTQPISFIGLPVVAAPVDTADRLPLGVQIIAAPWREDLALRLAAMLERQGVLVSHRYRDSAQDAVACEGGCRVDH
jgi:AtzE family amidohydrolase